MPVIAARLALVAVHALLHDGPVAIIRDDEAVQVEIETILHGGAINLSHQAAGPCKFLCIDADERVAPQRMKERS